MMRLGILLAALVTPHASWAAQSLPTLQLVSPAQGEPASGVMELRADVLPPVKGFSLTFYVDGNIICDMVPGPVARCSWNAGGIVREHLVRVVASLPDGQRLVVTRRTPKIDLAEHVKVRVVQVGVIVTDGDGDLVSGLTKESFRLFEEGRPQTLSHFSAEAVSLDLLTAIDVSGSMEAALPSLKAALRSFVDAIRPGDRVSLLAFNEDVFTLADRETDRTRLIEAIEGLKAWGGTALYDVLGKAVDAVGEGAGRRAILVFSDGADRSSSLSLEALRQKLEGSDAMLFIVALGNGSDQAEARDTLNSLAESTGGRVLYASRTRDLSQRFQTVLDELAHQYVLGFEPTPGTGTAWRQLRVETVDRKYRVRARRGYRPIE